MGFVLFYLLTRWKPLLKASRFFHESIDSLSFLLDPSWPFVSFKNNYFLFKRVICDLHTKSAPSSWICPGWELFNPTKTIYIERWLNLFETHTQKVRSTRERVWKEEWSCRRRKEEVWKTKIKFLRIFLSHVWSFWAEFKAEIFELTAGLKFWS